jgi:hypothetical protein
VHSFVFGPSAEEIMWAKEQLARFSYKPGWKFDIVAVDSGIMLKVKFTAADTYNPDKEIVIEGKFALMCMLDWERHRSQGLAEEFFAKDMEHTIWRVEQHEAQEWLRRDGTIYNNPHK